ncbi:MAG: hypothetical protein AAFR45_02810 [Pseudomonadota bacterium]
MIRTVFGVAAVLFSFGAVLASAQTVGVRSGAHDGFARLVVDVSAGQKWTLIEADGGATLQLQGHGGGFDTSRIFDRIDRSFISDVSATNSTLQIEFACDCAANAFAQGARMIVVDVARAPAIQEETRATATSDFSLSFVGQNPLRFSDTRAVFEPFAPRADATAPRADASETSALRPEFDEALTLQTPEAPAPTSNAAQLQQAREKIVSRIGAAATQGLLKANGTRIDLPTFGGTPQIDTSIFDSSETPRAGDDLVAPLGGNVRITSSADIPVTSDVQLATSTTLGVRCIDPSLIAVQSWGSDLAFSDRIADLRTRLYTEFDRLDTNAAIDLTRAYLHYGFGAEAQHVLALDPSFLQDFRELSDLADIMEYGEARGSGYLKHFADCDTNLALWAILANPEINPSDTLNVNAALRGLNTLPLHMRKFVAPQLSRRLMAYGDEDGAAAALRGLERTADPLAPAAQLAKADVEMAQGKTDEAQDRLADVISSNAEQSAEALIKFVESHLEEDGAIDHDIATLVEAYALELRDDPIGAELQKTHVLALAKSGQFEAAFDALDRIRQRTSSETEDALRSSLVTLLTKSADDITFLNHAFVQMGERPEWLKQDTRIAAANRLSDLGFSEEAETVISTLKGTDLPSKTKVLRAQIALDLERPEEALAFLFGIESEQADALRAEASLRAGAYDTAQNMFSQTGNSDGQQQAAWLSEDWARLSETSGPVFQQVAEVAQTPLEVSPDVSGMLARTSATIEESTKARDAIRALLAAEQFTQEPEE